MLPWIQQAEKLYTEGKKYYQIGNLLGVNRKAISRELRKLGYQSDIRYVRHIDSSKLTKNDYSFAETVFEVIDTEEKAYWLGFLYADGYISDLDNTVALALAEKDKDHLIKYREFFKLNSKKIYCKTKTINGTSFQSYEFSVTNKRIKNCLITLGCGSRKTFNIDFPNSKQVPDYLMHHFIRGYFDGDGCVTQTQCSYVSIEMLGTEAFLDGYQKWTGLKYNKLHKFNTTKIMHSMYSGFAAILILDRLYHNATIFLKRKYLKYQELRRLRLMTMRRPKSIIAELSGKGLLSPNPTLKALLEEAKELQQCNS